MPNIWVAVEIANPPALACKEQHLSNHFHLARRPLTHCFLAESWSWLWTCCSGSIVQTGELTYFLLTVFSPPQPIKWLVTSPDTRHASHLFHSWQSTQNGKLFSHCTCNHSNLCSSTLTWMVPRRVLFSPFNQTSYWAPDLSHLSTPFWACVDYLLMERHNHLTDIILDIDAIYFFLLASYPLILVSLQYL